MKRQILEEKIAGLEHQASADRLEKVETLIGTSPGQLFFFFSCEFKR